MSLTLEELLEKLKDIDEITLLERLNIKSDDLIERFADLIEDRFDEFNIEFEEEEDE